MGNITTLQPGWPSLFLERRRFGPSVLKAENKPYVQWLLDFYTCDCGGDDESDDEGDENDVVVESCEEGAEKNVAQAAEEVGTIGDTQDPRDTSSQDKTSVACNTVRRFMKGVIGDADALRFADQVELVAGFCEHAVVEEVETPVALIDDRSAGEAVFSKGRRCKTYLGPLTPTGMREALSKDRFRVQADGNVATNNGAADSERRTVFITDLSASSIEALAATATRNHALALKNFFYRYLRGLPFLGVSIPSHGFPVFALELSFPYYVLRDSKEIYQDARIMPNGKPLRQWLHLPPLSSASADTVDRLYEAQASITVTGLDQWIWTAYCSVDTYYDASKDRVEHYHRLKDRTGLPDPLGAGQIPAHNLIWTPREYFLRVVGIRMNQARREWFLIGDKIEDAVNQSKQTYALSLSSNDPRMRQKLRDFSSWSNQMVAILRTLTKTLSDTIRACEKFEREDMCYFHYDGDSPVSLAPPSLTASLREVAKTFGDLKDLREKLELLKKELCENIPQGVNAHLGLENHEAAVFQRKATSVLTVFTPLALASAMFSTEGVLPFTPSLGRFTSVSVILGIMIVLMPMILSNWTVWVLPIIQYLMSALKKAALSINERRKLEVREVILPLGLKDKLVFWRRKSPDVEMAK